MGTVPLIEVATVLEVPSGTKEATILHLLNRGWSVGQICVTLQPEPGLASPLSTPGVSIS